MSLCLMVESDVIGYDGVNLYKDGLPYGSIKVTKQKSHSVTLVIDLPSDIDVVRKGGDLEDEAHQFEIEYP